MASLKITERPLVETPTSSNPNVLAEDDGALVRIPASALPGAKVDASLTQPGQAADAAEVGKQIGALTDDKVNRTGWDAYKYLCTDLDGNVIATDASSGGSGVTAYSVGLNDTFEIGTEDSSGEESGVGSENGSGSGASELNYNKSIYLVTVEAGQNFILSENTNASGTNTDWGDGTVDAELSHTYTTVGSYYIQTDHFLDPSGAYSNTSRSSISDVLSISNKVTTMAHFFRGTGVTKINCVLPPVADYSYAFYRLGISAPPALPEGITNLSHAFELTTTMTILPELPSTVTIAQYCFRMNRAAQPATNYPAGLTDVRYMYQGSSITETGEPWNSISPSLTTSCFAGCTNIDLSAVPTAWGGTME